jgi:hypothetical protein
MHRDLRCRSRLSPRRPRPGGPLSWTWRMPGLLPRFLSAAKGRAMLRSNEGPQSAPFQTRRDRPLVRRRRLRTSVMMLVRVGGRGPCLHLRGWIGEAVSALRRSFGLWARPGTSLRSVPTTAKLNKLPRTASPRTSEQPRPPTGPATPTNRPAAVSNSPCS